MRYYREQVYLSHHGILGQKWGVRRYQNEDGTLTEAGKKRLNRYTRAADRGDKRINKYEKKATKYFDRGQKKFDSWMYSEADAKADLQRSNAYNRKATIKRARLIKKYQRAVKNMDVSKLDQDFVQRGENYLKTNNELRKQMYSTVLADVATGNNH